MKHFFHQAKDVEAVQRQTIVYLAQLRKECMERGWNEFYEDLVGMLQDEGILK